MVQTKVSRSGTRALIEKPPLAVVLASGDGQSAPAGFDPGSARQARIREAAYARYERRGRVHGQDIDDWLAAEAEVDGRQ